MILTAETSVKVDACLGMELDMIGLPADRMLRLLAELKAAYRGFPWESELWPEVGHRRSPYRTLVLFGLSARTRDALLVQMCRRFFRRFPDAGSLWDRREGAAQSVTDIVRAGQLPVVASMAFALGDGTPRCREELLGIRGVGDKIAECVLAYGWGDDALPLDANCVRVVARVFGLEKAQRTPAMLRESLKSVYLGQAHLFQDLAIGMVDVHEILRLHGQVCCARKPDCSRCPVSECLSRREPRNESKSIRVTPALWDDWRELINEPA